MADIDPAKLGARAETMIKALAPISAEPNRLVRLFLSPEHRRAADLVTQWMCEAGLAVTEDALGTLRGRIGEGPRLLIGSHLDSVADGGNYDGPLGVIAGILAAAHFGGRPPVPIDVLAFGDEEGSRFPSTLSSSAACAGVFEMETLRLADRNGMTFADALAAYGKNTGDIPKAAYKAGEAAAYVELHIEQGPLLEAEKQPLGVVTGIVGQSRVRVTVTGEAGHAGTVPMTLRRDALAGAAAMIMMVERIAKANAAASMVATVGRIEALPGATNIIPGTATFTVDLRAMSDKLRHTTVATIQHEARGIAKARNLAVAFEPFHDAEAAPCDVSLQDRLAAAIGDFGGRALRMPSGAGHDAQMMARLCPSAMMFVRCRAGISHNPAEYCAPADMGMAVAALIRFIERFKL
ncbi:MAG: allantoate amidohydrolase [Pseudolabrys sp.]|nr:allantoate amidohydrolase [Pseudolabrys sp.]MSP32485.1 allantoate amidohydrolase [Pseudolabrys sp.]